MGTRNLTVVIHNQEVKVAQYGQWDGYPEGQGVEILGFLSAPEKQELLKQVLSRVRFQNESDIREQQEFLCAIGSKDGWMNHEQYQQFKGRYPLHISDVGGEILERLIQSEDSAEIILIDSYLFAGDSLWCEWAYVIDFDQNVFEVYKGFNTSGITTGDRFFGLYQKDSDYYPVKKLVGFPLDHLPDTDEFIILCRQKP